MTMERVAEFSEAYQKRHELAQEWKDQGKRVFGVLYGKVPEEILSAADIVPVQLVEDREHASYVSGKPSLDRFYCDFVVNLWGQGLKGIYDYLDGIVMYDACEAAKVLAGVWFLRKKVPFFYWYPCSEETKEGARIFHQKEMNQFKARIEEFAGRRISSDDLSKAIRTYNENRSLMKRLYQARREDPSLISEREFFEVFQAGLVMPKEQHSRMVYKLLERIVSEASPKKKPGPRLFLSCVISEECISSETDLVSMVEELGGEIVSDDLLFGPRYYWEPTPLTKEPMEDLLDRYIGGMPMPFKSKSEQWTELLVEEARRQKVQGAIVVIPKYCTLYLWDYPFLQSRFEKAGIKTLVIEGQENIPQARTLTRIEAFLETLAH